MKLVILGVTFAALSTANFASAQTRSFATAACEPQSPTFNIQLPLAVPAGAVAQGRCVTHEVVSA